MPTLLACLETATRTRSVSNALTQQLQADSIACSRVTQIQHSSYHPAGVVGAFAGTMEGDSLSRVLAGGNASGTVSTDSGGDAPAQGRRGPTQVRDRGA